MAFKLITWKLKAKGFCSGMLDGLIYRKIQRWFQGCVGAFSLTINNPWFPRIDGWSFYLFIYLFKVVNIYFRLAAERIEEEDLKDLTCSPLSTSPQISIFKKTGVKSPNCDVTTSRQHIYNVSFRF